MGFDDAPVQCPRCINSTLTTGDLQHCPSCKGTWVATDVLAAHVGKMQTSVSPKLRWKVDDRPGLPCAVCRTMMEAALLFETPVERCHQHGVWFDKNELSNVLHRSSGAVERRESSDGVTVAEVIDAADVATDAGLVIAEAGSDVVDGVLDILGGIFGALLE